MRKRRVSILAAFVGLLSLAGLIFAGSAQAVNVGYYYCGATNNPHSTGRTVHRSGPNTSWYFTTDRCAAWQQTKSGSTYYSSAVSGTFASLKITSMYVPDAIEDTVYLLRIEYSDKYDVLCTAFPAFGSEPMGNGETINFGINSSSGLVEDAYLIDTRGDVTTIPMDDHCTSGNHWTSKIQIAPTNYQPYVQWVFTDGADSGNDQFTTSHYTYNLTG